MGILRIRDLNKGMALKQGDKTTLKFELYDANDDPLVLSSAGKVYFKQKGQVYAEENVTITTENVVSFKLNTILPAGKYYIEFVVDDKVFPSQDIDTFHITSSVLGDDITVIAINGIDRVAERALTLIEDDLQAIEEAELTRTQAELDRQSQEEARETAEGERDTAEVQRKADHANRSAEFDGKADKVVLKNFVENGNFSEGLSGWVTANRDIEVSSGKALVKGISDVSYQDIVQNDVFNPSNTVYLRAKVKSLNDGTDCFFQMSDGVGNRIFNDRHSLIKNKEHHLSGLYTPRDEHTQNLIGVRIFQSREDFGSIEGYIFEVSNIMAIDLTEAFGEGNEPTKEEMDELIKVIGYIDGEYALNNKEMLGYLMNSIGYKANKKQEDWITPTLLNGATGSLKYRKNSLGKLEFKGTLLHNTTKIAGIPLDYAPSENTFFVVASTALQNFKVAKLDYTGGLYFQQPAPSTNFEVDFNGIVINLD